MSLTIWLKNKFIKNKWLVVSLKVLITSGTLIWFIYKLDFRNNLVLFQNVDWSLFFLSLIISSFWIFPYAYRWLLILRFCDYKLSFLDALRYNMIGVFFNSFLPTGKGGDVIRGILVSRGFNLPLEGVWTTILIERLIGFFITLFYIILTYLIFFPHLKMLNDTLVLAVILILLIAMIRIILISHSFRNFVTLYIQKSILNKVKGKITEVRRILEKFWQNISIQTQTLALTLVNQIIQVFSAYVLAKAIPNFEAPFSVFLLVIPLSYIAVLLPSIGGYGVREAGFILFFSWFGIREDSAAMFGMLRLLGFWIYALAGGILFIMDKKRNRISETI